MGRSLGAGTALALCVFAASLGTGCSGPTVAFRDQSTAAAAPGAVAPGADPIQTGSIGKPPKSFGADLDEEDWRRAYGAMTVALDPQGNGKPVKWENPDTTLRGIVSPTGLPYVANDEICRDFLASVIAPRASRFVRGTGCKPAGGAWSLKRLRSAKEPLKEPLREPGMGPAAKGRAARA